MPDLGPVRNRVWSLFLTPSPPERRRFAAAAAEGRTTSRIVVFSAFNEAHVDRAMAIAAELMRIANEGPVEQALMAVVDAYEARRGTEHPDLLDYALMVFITHHPRGATLAHAIPPLTLRNPELVAPSRLNRSDTRGRRSVSFAPAIGAAAAGLFAGGALPSDELEWYREDPFANEHHGHWHVVYPVRGVPNPANPATVRFKDRQGEIFFYMHQQMLARYDAERLGVGLPRVAPLANYRAAVATGYDPGQLLIQQGFGARQPNVAMVDIPGDPATGAPPYTVTEHETRRANVNQAIAARSYTVAQPPLPMTDVSLLGSTVESNGAGIGSVAGPAARVHYGSLHNNGHGTLATASVDGPGPMTSTTTAIRDPVFYEWHKHIDDFYATWQIGGAVQTFADRPPVRVRKAFDPAAGAASSPDILFVFEDALPAGALADLNTWAAATFGGAQWDTDFSATPITTATLETAMLRRDLTLADHLTTVPVDHLTHRPFVYAFRVENLAQARTNVTVRVFIAPIVDDEHDGSDRRVWIEMDKFVLNLEAGEKRVAARRGAQSSVIKKPAVMVPELLKEVAVEFDAQQFAAMKAAGLPAALATRLQPFVGRVVGVSVIGPLFNDAEWDIVVPLLLRFARIVPSEQPQRPGAGTPEEVEAQEAFNYCTCGWPVQPVAAARHDGGHALSPRGDLLGLGNRSGRRRRVLRIAVVLRRARSVSRSTGHGVPIRAALLRSDPGRHHGQ